MTLKLTNNASSTLTAGITNSATTITVQTADASLFPVVSAGDWFPLALVDLAGNMEIVRATARAAAVITITRAQEGTTAKAFAAGSRVDLRLTAAAVMDLTAALPKSSAAISVADPQFGGGVGQGDWEADTAAFQAALDSGLPIFVPPTTLQIGRLDVDDDYCLLVTKPVNLTGVGPQSQILIKESISGGDILKIKPVDGVDKRGWGVEKIRFTPEGPSNGFASVIGIDLTQSSISHLNHAMFSRIVVEDPTNAIWAIKLYNDNSDGFFCSTVSDCQLAGGVDMTNCGDSLNFLRNTLTGPNVGLKVKPMMGAAMIVIEQNNITSKGGALIAEGANQLKFRNNQVEQAFAYTGDQNASITLNGCTNSEVYGNNVNTHDRVDGVLLTNGSMRNTIKQNRVAADVANGKYHVQGTVYSYNNDFADNDFYDADGVKVPIAYALTEFCTPNIGLFQKIALSGTWVDGSDPSFVEGLYAVALPGGQVQLKGSIGAGEFTPGSLIAQLPSGLHPTTKNIRVHALIFEAGAWAFGVLLVGPDGSLVTQSFPGNTIVHFDDVSFSIN